MTPADLKQIPGFQKWADEGESKGYLRELAEHIDEEIGDTGYLNVTPHQANINLGIQDAVRRVKNLLKDLFQRRHPVVKSPPATYGVTDEPEK